MLVCVQHEIDHLNGVVCMDRRIDMTIKRTEKKIGRNQLVTIKKGDGTSVEVQEGTKVSERWMGVK